MALSVVAAAVLLAGTSSTAPMDVATFLAKAERVERRGPFGLLSKDFKRIKREVDGAERELRAEQAAYVARGETPPACVPVKLRLSHAELIRILQAVPDAEKPTTEVKAALRTEMIRRYPC